MIRGTSGRQFLTGDCPINLKETLVGLSRAVDRHCGCCETGKGLLEYCTVALGELCHQPFCSHTQGVDGWIGTLGFIPLMSHKNNKPNKPNNQTKPKQSNKKGGD